MQAWDEKLSTDAEILPEDLRELTKPMGFIPSWLGMATEIGYWRKANQIHNWFVENVQGGYDEAEPHLLEKTDLQELLITVEEVLSKKDLEVAEEELPSTSGFFFGNTYCNELYFDQLEETEEILSNVLRSIHFDKYHVYYDSSW